MENPKAEKATKGRGLGNTITKPYDGKKEYRQLFWTWNNYSEDDLKGIKAWFDSRKNLEYIFQQEIGETGTPHLQGCFNSKSSISFDFLKKKFPKVHWEPVISWNASIEYCSKSLTRDPNGQTYSNFTRKAQIARRAIVDYFDHTLCRPWQQKVLDEIKNECVNDRKIHWYCDFKGGCGKSTLVRHLLITYPGEILCVSGKECDIKFGISEFVKKNDLKVLILDLPRTVEDYVSYSAIEQVKNGYFFSTKYESGQCVFNIPHIYVFANFEPKYESFSEDRWDVQFIEAVAAPVPAARVESDAAPVPADDQIDPLWNARSLLR